MNTRPQILMKLKVMNHNVTAAMTQKLIQCKKMMMMKLFILRQPRIKSKIKFGMKLKEIEKKLREIDLKEQKIGSTKKHCDEKFDRINETVRNNQQHLTENCSKSKTLLYESDTEGKSQRKTSLTNPVVLPENYNGDGVWEDHKQNIEACASVNGWNKEQQVQFLAVSLVGPARELLLGVPLKSAVLPTVYYYDV